MRSPLRASRVARVVGAGAGLAMLAGLPGTGPSGAAPKPATTTPIQHLVVIFQENVSFDHYFGTYPAAANTSGQPFAASPGTPAVNGLTPALLTANPNKDASGNTANPRRYDPANINDLLTCDQDHNYNDEQRAFDNGAMDKFVTTVGNGAGTSPTHTACNPRDVMNYYDGNTVTGMWNYAQRYAMSDNSYGTTFGPSSPGAINLISGDTGNVDTAHEANSPSIATTAKPNADLTPDGSSGGYSLTSDAQPYWDDCSTRDAVGMSGTNVGDSLNGAGLSWGWFQGGFRPSISYADALAATGHSGQPTSTFTPDQFKSAGFQNSVPHSSNQGICDTVHPIGVAVGGTGAGSTNYGFKDDYIPHHEPFQYYASTANPHHLTLPTDGQGNDTLAGLRQIGTDTQHYAGGVPQFDTPNHQYDTSDFDQLVAAIGRGDVPPATLPAVSFLKAPGYEDGHAAYSDPIDEQQFVAREIDALQATPDWRSTAVVIAYDDSDGWYDHAYSGVTNPSQSVADALTGPGLCGTGAGLAGQQGRCGYGPRMPLLVISPWAKANYVDHTLTDLSSIPAFVENNWELGRINGSFDSLAGPLTGMFDFSHAPGEPPNARRLILDPATGQPVAASEG